MLSRLILENFKSFGQRTEVPLAPITVLVGENSAGKSSVIQSLLLLKQSLVEEETRESALLFSGPLVDLGNPREVLFGHDVQRLCEIALLTRPAHLSDWTFYCESAGLGITFGCGQADGAAPLDVAGLCLYFTEDDDGAARPLVELRHPSAASTEHTGALREQHRSWSYGSLENSFLADVSQDHPAIDWCWHDFRESTGRILEALEAWPNTALLEEWPCYQLDGYRGPCVIQYLEFLVEGWGTDFLAGFKSWLGEYDDERYLNLIHAEAEDHVYDLRGCLPVEHRFRMFVPGVVPEQSEFDKAREEFEDSLHVEGLVPPSDRVSWAQYLEVERAEGPSPGPDFMGVLHRLLGFLNFDLDDPYSIPSPAFRQESPLFPKLGEKVIKSGEELAKVLRSLVYLGPLRQYPERYYLHQGVTWPDVGKFGANLPDILLVRISAPTDHSYRTRLTSDIGGN